MKTMHDLKNLVEQTLAQRNIWVRCGEVLIQAYENRLAGGGVQFNLRRGTQQDEADMRVMEAKPGFFTVAVVPHDGVSIEYGERKSKTFGMDDSLETLRTAFPHGRNVNAITNGLLAYDGD